MPSGHSGFGAGASSGHSGSGLGAGSGCGSGHSGSGFGAGSGCGSGHSGSDTGIGSGSGAGAGGGQSATGSTGHSICDRHSATDWPKASIPATTCWTMHSPAGPTGGTAGGAGTADSGQFAGVVGVAGISVTAGGGHARFASIAMLMFSPEPVVAGTVTCGVGGVLAGVSSAEGSGLDAGAGVGGHSGTG